MLLEQALTDAWRWPNSFLPSKMWSQPFSEVVLTEEADHQAHSRSCSYQGTSQSGALLERALTEKAVGASPL